MLLIINYLCFLPSSENCIFTVYFNETVYKLYVKPILDKLKNK